MTALNTCSAGDIETQNRSADALYVTLWPSLHSVKAIWRCYRMWLKIRRLFGNMRTNSIQGNIKCFPGYAKSKLKLLDIPMFITITPPILLMCTIHIFLLSLLFVFMGYNRCSRNGCTCYTIAVSILRWNYTRDDIRFKSTV